jgi:hypothetical protein
MLLYDILLWKEKPFTVNNLTIKAPSKQKVIGEKYRSNTVLTIISYKYLGAM